MRKLQERIRGENYKEKYSRLENIPEEDHTGNLHENFF